MAKTRWEVVYDEIMDMLVEANGGDWEAWSGS